ncbi:MAG: T9SS type A sorting domain-containing protein [Bacteroidetes bacterium]|nr:T9SS type A sorting domain-containing protein [Bacteroidota bacterium]
MNNFDILVSPNPSIGIVTIKIFNRSKFHKGKLILRNSIGKNLLETTFFENNIQLDMSNVAKGFYFIEVVSNNLSVTTKLILN